MDKCRVCGSSNFKKKFKKYNFWIVECQDCSLIITNFSPDKNFYQDFYKKDYFIQGENKRSYDDYSTEKKSLNQTFKCRIDSLSIKKESQGNALDFGCAYGYFLQQMPSSWNKFGIEISSHAAQKAKKNNPDASIKIGKLESNTFPREKFDLITMWDVIEHLNNPKQDLKIIFDLLKGSGRFALSTGNVNSLLAKILGKKWHLYNPPQHLSYFSPKTIKTLLSSIGFSDIQISHPPAYYPLSYLSHKLGSLYDLKLSIPKKINSLVVPVNLWDIMKVTACKQA